MFPGALVTGKRVPSGVTTVPLVGLRLSDIASPLGQVGPLAFIGTFEVDMAELASHLYCPTHLVAMGPNSTPH